MSQPAPAKSASDNAFDAAQLVYTRELCARDFWTDLLLHLRHGYVFATPDAFIMGRPVDRYAPYEEITNPAQAFPAPNAWLVYLAAIEREKRTHGLRTFLRYEPYELPWIGWERGNRLRWHRRDKIVKALDSQSLP